MSGVFIAGLGAVSPAGWTVASLRSALAIGLPLPAVDLPRPGWARRSLSVRQVPPPEQRPAFVTHPRLRRTSPVAHHTLSAALEALGVDAALISSGALTLGVIYCTMNGCVNYSRRFYDEVLKDPRTASPLLFPETVFNSPASHLGSLLGATAVNYTLVGDAGVFLQGLALAAEWLTDGRVGGCLVVGAEETDWLLADALRLFDRQAVAAAGAGAIYLRIGPERGAAVRLSAVTNPHLFRAGIPRRHAAQLAREEIAFNPPPALLCDGLQGSERTDRDEREVWADWTGIRISPKRILGEGFTAAAAWQCVAAADMLGREPFSAATVSVVGCHAQAIAGQFIKTNPTES